jgi:hypothetical protein
MLWPIIRYYSGIRRKRLRISTKIAVKPVGDPAEIRSRYLPYKKSRATAIQTCSVTTVIFLCFVRKERINILKIRQ